MELRMQFVWYRCVTVAIVTLKDGRSKGSCECLYVAAHERLQLRTALQLLVADRASSVYGMHGAHQIETVTLC